MGFIVSTLASIWTALKAFLSSYYAWLFAVLKDFALFWLDLLLSGKDVVLGVLLGMVGTWQTFTLNALFAVLPSDVAIIAFHAGVADGMALIAGALTYRMFRQFLVLLAAF